MRLSELARREAFALLGPGFSGGTWRLLAGFRESREPDLVLAAFEDAGRRAHGFAAATNRDAEPVFDVAPLVSGHEVLLHAGGYAEAVGAIRAAIAAGDVYQVCYTVRATLQDVDGATLLATFCADGAPRFAAWLRLPDGREIVSASPELFFAVDGSRVRTEPMKGTARPDAAGALLPSAKEQSELAMITDLLRNDLTPVCRPRTVRVADPRRLVALPYALQCVSDIEGELLPGTEPLDVLAALHPGGSVTGAPKSAALRIIAGLEPGPRGPYCGALGLLRPDGATFSLLIRTAVGRHGDWTYGVGSGIVWDSSAAAELSELHVKLGALRCRIRSSE